MVKEDTGIGLDVSKKGVKAIDYSGKKVIVNF